MAQNTIIDEIKEAIENIKFGSVEVIVQNGEVTQISTRIIKKTIPAKQMTGAVVRKSTGSGININFKY